MSMDKIFLQARVTATQNEIILWEAAQTAIASGVLSYTIDSGQSRQTVTRQDLDNITSHIDALYARLEALEARLNPGGTICTPGW